MLSVIVAVGVAAGISYSKQSEYRAEMAIVVGQGGGLLQPGFGESPEPFTQTISGLLKSDVVARKVISSSGVRVLPATLTKNLSVSSRPESTVLDVSYDSSDQELALNVLRGVAAVFPNVLADRFPTAKGGGGGEVSVTVFDPPRLLADPVAPRPVRNMVIAAALGLLVGIALAIAMDVFARGR